MSGSFQIGAILLAWSSVLLAQEKPLIEEIVVTAQRIEENASKVPIAINAFDETMIEDRRIVGLDSLQLFTPSLSYTTSDTGDTTFSIRGVGSLVSVNDGESGVSLHINEIPLPPGQPPVELYDVARMEVLRGPQGTLYGRNATGGVINVITNPPSFDGLSGYADLELGDFNHRRLRAAVNLPIGERLAIRVAGLSWERDGFTDNLAGGEVPGVPDDVDGRDLYSMRASAVWRVTDATELSFLYERFEEDDDRIFRHQQLCTTGPNPAVECDTNVFGLEPANHPVLLGPHVGQLGIAPMGAANAEQGLRYEFPRPAIDDLRDVHLDFAPVYELDQDLFQLALRHDFGAAEVSLSAGYQQWQRHDAFDSDFSVGHTLNPVPQNPSGLYPVSVIPGGVDGLRSAECNPEAGQAGVSGGCVMEQDLDRWFRYRDLDEEREHWSVELKMRTQNDGRFNFLLGGNYQSSTSKYLESWHDNLWDVRESIGDPPLGFPFVTRWYPGFVALEAENEFESYSAFGEAYVSMSDRLRVTLGLRYNNDQKRIADRVVGFSAWDANAIVGGILGRTWWTRRGLVVSFDEQNNPETLLELYGATEAFASATNLVERMMARDLVPLVPQTNEIRTLRGSPTKQTWDAWTGRVGLDWQFTDDAMAYAMYSRGYKPGGFNPGTVFTGLAAERFRLTYDREDVDAFELGLKALVWDGSASVKLAAFFADYKDMQLSDPALESISEGQTSINVDAETYGAELEFEWRPAFAPRLGLELGYSWLETEVTDGEPQIDPFNRSQNDPELVTLISTIGTRPYVARAEDVLPLVDLALAVGAAIAPDDAPAARYPNGIPVWFDSGLLQFFGVPTAEGVPVDLVGQPLPESPEHTLHLAASYTWDVAGGALTARWDYFWQDDMYMTLFQRPVDRVKAWDQHNASLIYESGNGRWSARAWINNITDDVHITGGMRSWGTFFSVSDPRQFGASFRFNFGAL
jgi:outer membrane receptor protein involved in Fe transport